MKHILTLALIASIATPALAALLIQDDFEYASQAAFEAAWPNLTTNKMQISSVESHSPSNSAYSAGDVGRRHYKNFGQEYAPSNAAPLRASFWMNIVTPTVPWTSSNGRQYSEIRGYTTTIDPNNSGANLQELVAIGIYNSTLGNGSPASQTKWQARVAFGGVGNGWIDLDLPGAPLRSAGWHKFMIEVKGAGVTNFYVDDFLSGTVTDSSATNTYDAFILGSGLSSNPGANVRNAYFDDVSITPEPASLALLALGALSVLRRR